MNIKVEVITVLFYEHLFHVNILTYIACARTRNKVMGLYLVREVMISVLPM
jgi:hypothetical protein